MSEASRSDGWWIASDGRWYPPELHPARAAGTADSAGWWQDEDGNWQPPRSVPAPTPSGSATVVGEAGGSAKRRAEQLKRDAERWETGGDGEARTAEALARLPHGFHVLHDLHVPGSKANIDHLVIGPTGAWLIDTKLYSSPLRYSGGTLWTGRHPIRRETTAVAGYADAVRDVLHVPVSPVLCFVDNDVPPEGELLGSVRAVSLDDLLALLTGPSGVPLVDVDSVARLARTLRTPTPRPERQRHEPAHEEQSPPPARRSGGGARASGRRSGRSIPSSTPAPARQNRKRKQGDSLLLRIVGAAIALALIFGFLNPLSDATNDEPPLDGPTIDTPTPLLDMRISCPTKGAGYRVRLQWPTTLPTPTPVAFEIASVTPGIAMKDGLWTSQFTSPPSIDGVWPSTEVKVIVQGIAEDGTRLTPTASVSTTPAEPC